MGNQNHIKLELCAPERPLVELDVKELVAPGLHGLFTVQPGHTPFFSILRTGALVVDCAESGKRFFAVHDGFIEVLNDRVVILAQTMEEEEEIDPDRAEAAKQRAQQILAQRNRDIDHSRAEAALERALARLHAHSRVEH